MKRLLALLLAVVIVFSSGIVVNADTKKSDVIEGWNKDLPKNHWARNDVNFFKGIGYLDGTLLRKDEPTIDPEKAITRAEFVSLINLVITNDFENEKEKKNFDSINEDYKLKNISDLEDSHWAKQHILWAMYNNSIGGYLNGKGEDENGNLIISPNANITRQEAMVIMSKTSIQKRAFSIADEDAKAKIKEGKFTELMASEAKGSLKFDDNDRIASWALPYVEDCFSKGIVNGNDNNEIQPLKNITRAEALKMLKNFIQKEKLKVGK